MKKEIRGILNKLRTTTVAFIIIIIGIITILFGFRNPETCILTAVIGGIVFFLGLFNLFATHTS
jgi:membrane-bound ClpP family serine protease